MLYGYPIIATRNNWFHMSLCQMLRRIHMAQRHRSTCPTWPSMIPSLYRERLKSRYGLRDRLTDYFSALGSLSSADERTVYSALLYQNRIKTLLANRCNCSRLADLPTSIHAPVTKLFEFSFDLLTDLGIRDEQYRVIYASRAEKLCPFCGLEGVDAPGAPREDLDPMPFGNSANLDAIPVRHS